MPTKRFFSKQSGHGRVLFFWRGDGISKLGGGFKKYISFSPLFGEDSHFDSYFSIGLNHQLVKIWDHVFFARRLACATSTNRAAALNVALSVVIFVELGKLEDFYRFCRYWTNHNLEKVISKRIFLKSLSSSWFSWLQADILNFKLILLNCRLL